jgi:PD-(D/E)XK nuclease superfamily
MSEINLSLYHNAGFSTSQMRSLEEFLEKNPTIHWISLNSATGIYELILDNQLMSDFRGCPAYFFPVYADGYRLKGAESRNWYLEFGILFHKRVEEYYLKFRDPKFILHEWAIKDTIDAWEAADMSYHAAHKEYQSIGGIQGFCGLMLAYATRFSAENERIRVIGTEIPFGKAKEVPLGSVYPMKDYRFYALEDSCYLNIYLSGRIDVLIDDGSSICPMDHKTMNSFRNDPNLRFELDEGPTGYVYAVNKILPSFLAQQGLDSSLLRRSCNKILMNFVSKSIPKEGERFKRLPILKTQEQLEAYRLRMLLTARNLFAALVEYASTGVAMRDTAKCTNWYMHDCTFINVHRQNSRENELNILNSFFEKKPIWNTEESNTHQVGV